MKYKYKYLGIDGDGEVYFFRNKPHWNAHDCFERGQWDNVTWCRAADYKWLEPVIGECKPGQLWECNFPEFTLIKEIKGK